MGEEGDMKWPMREQRESRATGGWREEGRRCIYIGH